MQYRTISILIISSGSTDGRSVTAAADVAEVHEPVDRPQQVIARHVPLEAELVEQRRMIGGARPSWPWLPLPDHSESEAQPEAQRNSEFFNTIRPSSPFSLLDPALQTRRSFRKGLRLLEAVLEHLRAADYDLPALKLPNGAPCK